VRPLHDRMAVILLPEAYEVWLDPHTPLPLLVSLLRPAPDDLLIAYPVSPRVNSPQNDDPSLIASADAPQQGALEL
jgi:putative SOS response-associated peptidase YedK